MPVQTSDIFQALTRLFVDSIKKQMKKIRYNILPDHHDTKISRQTKFSVFFHPLHCHCTVVNSLLLSRRRIMYQKLVVCFENCPS